MNIRKILDGVIERNIMKKYPFISGYFVKDEVDNEVYLVKLYYKDYSKLKPVRQEIIDELSLYFMSLSPKRKERLIVHFINL